jgi:hypothetical protein
MNIVIATGCPHSGWEMVLPILQQAGLEPDSRGFAQWHDDFYHAAGIADPLSPHKYLSPEAEMAESATSLFVPESTPKFFADSRSLWLLDFWAETLPEARFLLFYTQAAPALAHALSLGMDPTVFLAGWEAANRQLLAFQRRQRRRALLFDAEASRRQPQAFVEICQRSGLLLNNAPAWPVADASATLERFIAAHLVPTHGAVTSLQTELEASAFPLEETAPAMEFSPQELFDSYRQRLARDRHSQEEQEALRNLEASNKEIAQENELLLLQLHQVQEELESVFLQKQASEQKQAELGRMLQKEAEERRDQLKQAQEALSRLEASQKEAASTNELLRLQLDKAQEDLEEILSQKQRFEGAYKALERQHKETIHQLRSRDREVQNLTRRLNKLMETASWKMTAPVRAVAKPFKKSDKEGQRVKEQMQLIKSSGLFDESWYLDTYQDVATEGSDPIEHYLRFGAAEGRNPSRQFDTKFYLKTSHDVAEAGLNPLVHFIKFGKAEGRLTSHQGSAA